MPLTENNNNNNNNSNNNMTDDDVDDTTDCIQVTLTRSLLHGFGIAVCGGNNETISYRTDFHNNEVDNQSLYISDVIKNGPADGKLLLNDRIINVNGHPVVRNMEHIALKLLRESTDFVNLIVQRRKPSMFESPNEQPTKCILNKTRKDEKFGIILDCRYFIKKIYYKNNERLTNIQEGDEIIKINETLIDRLTLQEAQKLIDKTKEQVVLYTIPNKFENEINNQQKIISACKQLQSDYNQHIFDQASTNNDDFIRLSNGTRYISFFTDTSSMGIRLAGGNKYGLFICEILSNSVAHQAGLLVADKILSVNNIDFKTFTREEAVLCLMNMKACQVNMVVSSLQHEYKLLLSDIGGDSFYIRSHFTCQSTNDEELSININDIFHVTDTLYNGQMGYWVATKLNNITSSLNKITGSIPNKSRAEELIHAAPNLNELIKSKRKLRSKFSDRQSRSILSLNYFKDEPIFNKVPCWKPMTNSKFPTYEYVKLKSVTIVRPVVLLGCLADIARDRLLEEYPDQFESPHIHLQSATKTDTNIIKLQSIKNVIQRNRHCLLDITPTAIEQLNYAECYPIVIFLKVSNRRQMKEIRNEYNKVYQKSSRHLFESCSRLECLYSYLFTSLINFNSSIDWYEILKSQIKLQQEQPIWMSNERSIDNDLLKSNQYFISTKFQSNSHFDMMNKYYDQERNCLPRVASDSGMFQMEKINLLHEEEVEEDNSISMQTSTMSLPNRSHSIIEIPTTDNEQSLYQKSLPHFKREKYIPDRNSSLTYRSYRSEQEDICHLHQQENESTSDRISARRQLMASKFRTINSNERVSLNDSDGLCRKNIIDKSTTTITEKKTAVNLNATWDRSTTSRPPNNNNLNLSDRILHYRSTDTVLRNDHIPSVNSNNKFRTESLLKQNLIKPPSILPNQHDNSLQKPRVYSYDDRISPLQQQTIHSSSSGSSILSTKDKPTQEVGETRSYSMQDGCNVIGSAYGIMNSYGGKLSCPLTGVSLSIPMGAIPEGLQQEIYFQVCQNTSNIEKFNGQLLSPIVICGPRGIQFLKPLELNLPHSAGNDAEELSLLFNGTNQNSKTNNQRKDKSMMMNRINHVTHSNVSILIDKF